MCIWLEVLFCIIVHYSLINNYSDWHMHVHVCYIIKSCVPNIATLPTGYGNSERFGLSFFATLKCKGYSRLILYNSVHYVVVVCEIVHTWLIFNIAFIGSLKICGVHFCWLQHSTSICFAVNDLFRSLWMPQIRKQQK